MASTNARDAGRLAGPPGASTFSSCIDHQLPALPWFTILTKRPLTCGNRILVTVLPGPVAMG